MSDDDTSRSVRQWFGVARRIFEASVRKWTSMKNIISKQKHEEEEDRKPGPSSKKEKNGTGCYDLEQDADNQLIATPPRDGSRRSSCSEEYPTL
jgi:hypothetical protein